MVSITHHRLQTERLLWAHRLAKHDTRTFFAAHQPSTSADYPRPRTSCWVNKHSSRTNEECCYYCYYLARCLLHLAVVITKVLTVTASSCLFDVFSQHHSINIHISALAVWIRTQCLSWDTAFTLSESLRTYHSHSTLHCALTVPQRDQAPQPSRTSLRDYSIPHSPWCLHIMLVEGRSAAE